MGFPRLSQSPPSDLATQADDRDEHVDGHPDHDQDHNIIKVKDKDKDNDKEQNKKNASFYKKLNLKYELL